MTITLSLAGDVVGFSMMRSMHTTTSCLLPGLRQIIPLHPVFVASRMSNGAARMAAGAGSALIREEMSVPPLSPDSITIPTSDEKEKENAGHGDAEKTAEFELTDLPAAEMNCWRPTADDVDRISWGKPAKKKTTGSRGVPHRLNEEERVIYDMARRKGFVEVVGSGWRKERRGAPLVNTYRNWCDARGVPVVYVFKGREGVDEVVLDLSPLRLPRRFLELALKCSAAAPGGLVEPVEDTRNDLSTAREGASASAPPGAALLVASAQLPSEHYGPKVESQGQLVRQLKARRLQGAPDVTAEMIDAEVQKLVALKNEETKKNEEEGGTSRAERESVGDGETGKMTKMQASDPMLTPEIMAAFLSKPPPRNSYAHV